MVPVKSWIAWGVHDVFWVSTQPLWQVSSWHRGSWPPNQHPLQEPGRPAKSATVNGWFRYPANWLTQLKGRWLGASRHQHVQWIPMAPTTPWDQWFLSPRITSTVPQSCMISSPSILGHFMIPANFDCVCLLKLALRSQQIDTNSGN